MTKWFVLLLTVFSLSQVGAAQELPRPLPDDPYPREPYPGEPPRGVEYPYSVGSGDVGRFAAKTYQFFPRTDLNRLIKIRVVGLKNKIVINEVKLVYLDNGSERSELMLPGDLHVGSFRETYLDGRAIYRIDINASSSNIFKKPGGYRVDVTAVR
ncbi:MAG: hypothetical protein KUL82_02165 [Bdellovibrio sp.]|nr:hypothetical protein [Bdellovibrio sp.]